MTLTQRERVRAPRPRSEFAPTDFRADIQMLRALAVGLVVLYHLWPERLTGGYVGVDIFFVISGFLITSHLWREAQESGTVRLGRFWARRARRLLPASLLVLAAAAAGTMAFAPPHLIERYLHEVLASTLYAENWYLAGQSIDYLGANATASPVQHYWSLGVEEQFYVILPLLLVIALAVASRLRMSTRRTVGILMMAVAVGSFAYSVWLTQASAAAYFSTFTRLWEFIAGAALALLVTRAAPRPWLAACGLALLGLAAFQFSEATPFPGWHAALPVVGTMLVLAGGSGTFVSQLGAARPVAHLARISYAVYLWHWPLIVLLPLALGRDMDLAMRLTIVVATLVLASASTLLIEEPFRRPNRLVGSGRPVVIAAWSVGGMAVVGAIVAAGLAAAAAGEKEASAEADAALAAVEVAADDAPREDPPPCVGAEALVESAGCAGTFNPGVFVPALNELDGDRGNREDCWTGLHGREFRMCTIGPEQDYERRLMVLGDSHSNSMIPTYERLARERGWRIDLAGHAGCYFTTRSLMEGSSRNHDACAEWRGKAIEAARSAEGYDAVVVTRKLEGDRLDVHREEVDGLVGAWSQVAPGTPVIAVLDNPAVGSDLVTCLDRAGYGAAQECAVERATALRPDLMVEAAGLVPAARVVDLSDAYCGPAECPVVIGGVVAYRPDGHHLSATFSETLAPVLGARIDAALRTATGVH